MRHDKADKAQKACYRYGAGGKQCADCCEDDARGFDIDAESFGDIIAQLQDIEMA